MREIKLLPCPFCGGEFQINVSGMIYIPKCTKCGCKLAGCITQEEAIEEANTRKPMERIIERLEGKKKTLCGTYDFYTKPLDRPSCKIAFNNGICESIEVVKEEGGIE